MENNRITIGALALLCVINSCPLTAHAQGTAFSYQGRLNAGTNSATGSYDLTFTLFDVSSGGSSVAGPVTNSAVGVTGGLFTTTLDLGANFSGPDRWLEIGVRSNLAGAFTTLNPRQQITPTPYAITAGNFTGAVSDGQLPANVAKLDANQTFSGANNFSSRVGLGAANGNTKLAVWDGGPTSAMGLGVGTGQFRFHLPDSDNRFSFLDNSDGNELVTIKGTGKVGIGTNAPAEKLDVRGNIKVGANAELFVPGGQENLRIVRGVFYWTGANVFVVSGSGYSVTRVNPGFFQVAFSPGFSDTPAVHVTPENQLFSLNPVVADVIAPSDGGMIILLRVEGTIVAPGGQYVDPPGAVSFSAIGGR